MRIKSIFPFLRTLYVVTVYLLMPSGCYILGNEYGVTCQSRLPYLIHDTTVYANGRWFTSAGYLGPNGAGKTDYGITEAVPRVLTVTWKDPSNVTSEVTVQLKDVVPSRLRDHEIILTITETGTVDVALKKNLKVF